jgi:hypothetical protein
MAFIPPIRSYVVDGPVGVPHRLTEDNIYNGYFIPAGSLVFANIWYGETSSVPLLCSQRASGNQGRSCMIPRGTRIQ